MARRRRTAVLVATGILLGSLGAWYLAGAGWIHAKAQLAQVLLETAWAARLAGDTAIRPWPWADTHPVARLQAPDLGVDMIVLSGSSGRTLAFGPGHIDGTVPPGGAGHSILSGHRDTHFKFLERLTPGMELRVQRPDGGWRRYRVIGTEVIDARKARLAHGSGWPVLSLVTCYPFDGANPATPWRYVVTAEAESTVAAR